MTFLSDSHEIYLIIGFGILVVIMLIIDLGVFNKHSHKVSNREAAIWSIIWIGLALLFAGVIYYFFDGEMASDYLTAYLIEKALSVDNLFVFILIFSFFQVPKEYHHKVLFWGILGAIISRAIFIFSGVWLIELTYLPPFEFMGKHLELNFLLTTFGVFLIYAGIQSARSSDEEERDFSKNLGVRIIRKIFPVTKDYVGSKFFVRRAGKRFATPLLIVVAVIELTDILFAVDSIPAIFAVTKDPIILYTSNIFAILGLRTLYFLLANFMHLFTYLKYGLAFILSFIGVKMLIMEFYKIPSVVSLSIVAGTLILSVLLSLLLKPQKKKKQQELLEKTINQ